MEVGRSEEVSELSAGGASGFSACGALDHDDAYLPRDFCPQNLAFWPRAIYQISDSITSHYTLFS